ncbi:MAG: phosphotransferase [Cyanobacteria bacterium J06643_5]
MNISNAIFQQYKLNIINVELLRDTDDLVYKITDNFQHHYTVKVQRKKLNKINKKLSDLYNWLDFLSQNISFYFPLPLRNINSEFCSQIQDYSQNIYNFVVYQWVDGEPISKQMSQKNNYKIGALMAELHKASSVYNKEAKALCRYDEKWLHDCFSIILNGAKIVDYNNKQLNQLENGLEIIKQYIVNIGYEKTNFGIIHSDLNFSNILIDSAGNLSVIDFDEAGFGHYWLDLAVTLDEFYDYDEAETMIKQFIHGYQTIRNIKFDSTTIKMFRGLSAILYAAWVFSPENDWVRATKLDYGKDALEKIRYVV